MSLADELTALLRPLVSEAVSEAMCGQAGQTDQWLSVERAAAAMDVSPATVRAWIRSGALPRHYAGRLLRIRLDELRAFMAEGRGRANDDAEVQATVRRLRGKATPR